MSYTRILQNNKTWAAEMIQRDPRYFEHLSHEQHPYYLYIGCSDSRVPADVVMGVKPGEVFVCRNIANVVSGMDLGAMSIVEYAVVHLGVKEILVCGHYGCGGIKAALQHKDLGLLNPWLRNIRDVYRLHEAELDTLPFEEQRINRLVELNVQEQCINVIKVASVQKSFLERGYPQVHGLVFNLKTGLLKDLELDFEAMLKRVQKLYRIT